MEFNEKIKDFIKEKWNIENVEQIASLTDDELLKLRHSVHNQVVYDDDNNISIKYLSNAIYGGSSHIANFWFDMDFANDITAESKNLILMMEDELNKYFLNDFINDKNNHTKFGITINNNEYFKDKKPVIYIDTDSCYTNYGPVLNVINESSNWTDLEKIRFIEKFSKEFMDPRNEKFLKEYFEKRHGRSVHSFELETIARSGIWLNVKKRYMQDVRWKDGRIFDDVNIKAKGIEIVKSSFPSFSRTALKDLVKILLTDNDRKYLSQKLNIKVQEYKNKFWDADIESISISSSINNYTKYIIDDSGEKLKVASKCPSNVRAAGNRNLIINKYKLGDELIYGGKCKIYNTTFNGMMKEPTTFAYVSGSLPNWVDKYAPIDRASMFQKVVLDPINRILEPIQLPLLCIDGSMQLSLF